MPFRPYGRFTKSSRILLELRCISLSIWRLSKRSPTTGGNRRVLPGLRLLRLWRHAPAAWKSRSLFSSFSEDPFVHAVICRGGYLPEERCACPCIIADRRVPVGRDYTAFCRRHAPEALFLEKITALRLLCYVARIGSFAFPRKGEVDLDCGEGIVRARGREDVAFRIGDPSETAEIGLAARRSPQVG